uniref:Exosome complex component RRP40 n=1 Tax=Rhipicephalus zambeziensis TaxID=60191 RepID=A0A224YY06_9ACAR
MSVNKLVLPGDVVDVSATDEKKCIVGPGLRKEGERVVATRAGILKHRRPNTYWVEGHQKRYIPAKGDCVIGVVTAKGGETVRVNIGSSEPATLSVFAFEGATKRNRPDVEVGDIVMAQVLMANRGMEPELVCMDSYGKKGIMGVLRSPTGFLIKVPINLINKLLAKDCSLLQTLGKRCQFEIALGHNGRIWVNGSTLQNTLSVCNAILSAENLTAKQIEERCHRPGT